MALTASTAFSGPNNRGFQLGQNSGQVHITYNNQRERSPSRLEPSSTVPFRRDIDFVDRHGLLAQIHGKCSAPASRTALVGLGGVGKSQLAIEYSYRVREESPESWVFWVHASTTARFEEGYRTIADRVKLSGWDEPKADILWLVRSWLSDEASGRWVMILDNADDPAIFFNPQRGIQSTPGGNSILEASSLSGFLPQSENGSVLVTSRNEDTAFRLTGSHENIIRVKPMGEGDALALLRKKLGGESNQDDAVELVQDLDYMPLAITQAAAFIKQREPRTTVSRYLRDFQKSDKDKANLLNRDAGDLRRDGSASNSVITTWQMSFEHIQQVRPSAAQLLSLMSFFDPQGIPEALLLYEGDNNIDMDREGDTNFEFEDDIFTLTSYSLITASQAGGLFEMHPLVQFTAKRWVEAHGELGEWTERYVTIMYRAFPTAEYENWEKCRVLYPHAQAVLACRPPDKECLLQQATVLMEAGWYSRAKGNYIGAEEMIRRALEGREKVLRKDHPFTLASVHDLAVVLRRQGKYEQAEEMNQRALEEYEKVLGKEHPYTLTSINNLSTVLQNQGKYKQAEVMQRQVLDAREKVLGKNHPDTLMSVNNLALMLQSQGKYEQAEEIQRQVLDAREKVLGEDHPNTLMSVYCLAYLLHKQQGYKDASALYQRANDGFKRTLGVDHPTTLACSQHHCSMLEAMDGLATGYGGSGRG